MAVRGRRYSQVEVKAGLFLAFCLALFVGMLLIFGKVSRIWRDRQEIHAVFASVKALPQESAVRYNGVEVGRVRSMKILHLDRAELRKLVPLFKRDLDFLPLDEETRRRLRQEPDYLFDAKCREALVDKTVIRITLEVLEGPYRRYRVDDQVRIASTLMGDTCLEIVSGSGPPLNPGEEILQLGSSGDFFSNLSRSVDSVKDVLSGVTDIVGAQERASFKAASTRLTPILDGINRISDAAAERLPVTARKAAGVDAASKRGLDSAGKLFERLQPDTQRLFDSASAARTALQSRYAALGEALEKAQAEFKTQTDVISAHTQSVVAASRPHFGEMTRNFRTLADRTGSLDAHMDAMTTVAGRLIEQSQPDLKRFTEGMRTGFENLKTLRYIRERISELIGRGDKGEHEFYTALETFRSLERAVRGPRDVAATLQDFRKLFTEPAPAGQRPAWEDIEQVQAKARKLERALEDVRLLADQAMNPNFTGAPGGGPLPPFGRKRAGWAVFPVR